MPDIAPDKVISTILKHDRKVTSYKIALLRAINDVVLTFPDLRTYAKDVAVPLRLLADYWVAYYWPFVSHKQPIRQGQKSKKFNDMAFRSTLTELREEWEIGLGGVENPADGFFLVNELRSPRKRATYPAELVAAYDQTVKTVTKTLEMPIRYAGVGEWSVFEKPVAYSEMAGRTVPVPGTRATDKCLVIPAGLWQTFRQMSLWVEALCIHEWCLFSEGVSGFERGYIYTLLTSRPDNRRPLTWERNQVDILLMEGQRFTCPWTERTIGQGDDYDMDHLLPIAVYPTNELWNLVPVDPDFNSHQKRDRLPEAERLYRARPHFEQAYQRYRLSAGLSEALQEDVQLRFSRVQVQSPRFAGMVAEAVVDLITEIAESRNVARF